MVNCDDLKREMDRIGYSGISGNPASGMRYLSLYATAKIMGCSFVNESDNPYFVKDPRREGVRFLIDMKPHDKGFLRENEVYRIDVDEDGFLRAKADGSTLFKFIPAGMSAMVGDVQRDLFFLTVDSGRHAGKVVNNKKAPNLGADSRLIAEPHDLRKPDLWSLNHHYDYGSTIDIHSPDGTFLEGAMDVPRGGSYAFDYILAYKWNGDWNQCFNFRPENYKRPAA